MQAQRDLNIYALYGQQKMQGNVEGPIFPTNGVLLAAAALGKDQGNAGLTQGSGVVGTNGNTKTGTIAATAINDTTITYTITGTTAAPIVGDILQIDTNVSTTKTAECRKVTVVSGTTSPYTLTLDSALNYAHVISTPVKNVVAPFTHTIARTNALDSITIEKNIGNYQSEQYAGCKINKFSMKADTTNKDVDFTADVMAKSVAILSSPTAVATDTVEPWPFVFSEVSLTLLGQALTGSNAVAHSFTLDIENGVKDTYTFNSAHTPQFITPVTFKATGTISVVFQSLNDATYGWFSKVLPSAGTPVQSSIVFSMAHPAGLGSGAFTWTLPQCNISKYTDEIKINDVVMVNLSYEASFQISSSSTVALTIVNAGYLPI